MPDSHDRHEGHRAGGHAHGDDERMLQALLLQDRVFAPLMTEIAAWLGVERGMSILDAGCGAGGMALEFARRGATVAAVARKFVPNDSPAMVTNTAQYPVAIQAANVHE